MRVVAENAVFGIFCRFGVPLIDLRTSRLPRLIGQARAMDLILTGRPVVATEAFAIGLASRVVPPGQARARAIELAIQLAQFPQNCLRNDRRAVLAQWDLPGEEAIADEMRGGLAVIASGEARTGAQQFSDGAGTGNSDKTRATLKAKCRCAFVLRDERCASYGRKRRTASRMKAASAGFCAGFPARWPQMLGIGESSAEARKRFSISLSATRK